MILGKPQTSSGPVLLFSNPPDYSELCTIGVFVNSATACGSSSKNQSQILKCRELIFTEPDVIATPHFGDDRAIALILQKSLYKTGRLQGRFTKIGLEFSKPGQVTPALYQACLTYTLQAKLAPNWNKAGQWLLQGRDFLTSSRCINAMKMSATVTSNDISMALQASALRTSSCKLSDLSLPPPIHREFLQNPAGFIPESYIMNTWCHVLPSMKKGVIVSVSKSIPEDSPFKTYRDFKRHWKNTYGYRLPDSDEGMLYYQVFFKPIGHMLFTYPDICLRSRDFHFLPRIDPKPILASFLQDVGAKMSTVCGQSLNLQPKAKYAKISLSSAASQNLTQANLTSRIPKTHATLRNPAIFENLYPARKQADDNTTNTAMSTPLNQEQGPNNNASKIHVYNKILNSSGKVVPLFKSKAVRNFAPNLCRNDSAKKIVPVFKAYLPACVSKGNKSSSSRESAFTPQKTNMVTSKTVSRSIDISQEARDPPIVRKLFERGISDLHVRPHFLEAGGKDSLPLQSSQQLQSKTAFPSFLQVSHNLDDEDFLLPTPGTTPQSLAFKNLSIPSIKRKIEDVGSPAVKKPRVKLQVQANVDVESLARQQQLSKVNAATLAAWLKEHQVVCKAKDKKPDLINRVNSFLRISIPEQ